MPRILRTNMPPFSEVMHECRDERGNRVQRPGLSNTLCRHCDTQIVYIWDNKNPKTRRP
jgi:hypothetical protein